MSWNDNGNNGSRDPWGNKNDGPDIDEAIKKFKSLVGSFMGGKGGGSDSSGGSPSFKKILPTALVVIIVLYSALGIYTVDAQEEAVVLRFGTYSTTKGPGIHWNPPFIDNRFIVNTEKLFTHTTNSSILTKDENIVNVETAVQYKRSNPVFYLLEAASPEDSIAQASESALRHVDILDRFNFNNYKMSLKASNIEMTVNAYRKISNLINQPLHLGITEAGSFRAGTVKSSIGVGMLLSEGIGDTIRISLASNPVDEIKVGWDILKSLNIRSRGVKIIACPSCSRQNFNVIEVVNELEERLEDIADDIEVAIIGCYVNGPGESKAAEIGLTGASPKNLLYVDGMPDKKISSENLVKEIEEKVREKLSLRNSKDIIARG